MSEIMHRFLESRFDQCTETCGWVAAIIAALSYGTFGVPIKETVSVDVHPLVLQSYKTFTMFAMSWLVIYMGEDVKFTPWGILSGLLWVLGGTGGIYGIRNAGMSVAVGTWSSCMVMINFFVGIICFREPVSSIPSTFASFVLLGMGLVGMSIYSAPQSLDSNEPLMEAELHDNRREQTFGTSATTQAQAPLTAATSRTRFKRSSSSEGLEMGADNYDPLRDPAEDPYTTSDPLDNDGLFRIDDKKDRVLLVNNSFLGLTKRQLGILGAVINGVLTGCSLVPVHYAKRQGFGGAAYMLSFSTGALFSNFMVWSVLFGAKFVQSRDFRANYESMPHWHLRQLWGPAFAAGILLAIAMFGSIMSVTYLGQGVGNSIIQSKIIISGLWGVFWYREISGGVTVAKWFGSASLTVLGIMWLSYERIHAQASAAEHHI